MGHGSLLKMLQKVIRVVLDTFTLISTIYVMPLYEYKCLKCEKIHEVMQKFSDPLLETCPDCGEKVEKLLSLSSFSLKGTGWYTTDYKRSQSSQSKASSSSDSKGSDTKASSSDSGSSSSGSTGT